jgi:hypothetical protein
MIIDTLITTSAVNGYDNGVAIDYTFTMPAVNSFSPLPGCVNTSLPYLYYFLAGNFEILTSR